MAILVTNQAGNLSDANHFYEVESYNVAQHNSTTTTGITLSAVTPKTQAMTFAHGGVFKGVGLRIIQNTSLASARGVRVALEELVGATWTERCFQTIQWKDMYGNTPSTYLNFSGGNYDVNYDNFSASITVDTTAGKWRLSILLTTGTGSAPENTAGTYMIGCGFDNTTISYVAYCDNLKSWTDGDTPYFYHPCELDINATFGGVLSGTETARATCGLVGTNMSDTTKENVSLLTCTNPSSTRTLTLKGILYVGGHGGVRIGTEASRISTSNRFILDMSTAPTVGTTNPAIYNHNFPSNINNALYCGRSSFFAYGSTTLLKQSTTLTETVVKPNALSMTMANPCVVTKNAHGKIANDPIVFQTTGTLPSHIVAGVTYYVKYINANSFNVSATPGGANISTLGDTQVATHFITEGVIKVAEDMSLQGWEAGDVTAIGRQNVASVGDLSYFHIKSISWTSITLVEDIPTYDRLINGQVINLTESKYGITIKGRNGVLTVSYLTFMNNLNVEGCYCKDHQINGFNYYNYFSDDVPANLSKMTFKNCAVTSENITSSYTLMTAIHINTVGFDVDTIVSFRSAPLLYLITKKMTGYVSGAVSIKNVRSLSRYSPGINLSGLMTLDDYIDENSSYISLSNLVAGSANNPTILPGSVIKNTKIWGNASGTGALVFGLSCTGVTFKDIYIDNATYPIGTTIGSFYMDILFDGLKLGTITDNYLSRAFYVVAGSFLQAFFKNSYGTSSGSSTSLSESIKGTTLNYTNEDGNANKDRTETTYGTFTRCGDGLNDTTVRTSGTGKFSLRMVDNTSLTPLEYPFNVPTGNIQNLTLVMSLWCKINSTSYYAGTNVMPRLTISYDDDTATAYAEAAQSTDWQLLFVPITPTTTFGEIKATISTDSNAGNRWPVTMTIASPWVVTLANHWFTGWEQVYFTTTGALPTGVIINIMYFVKYIDANTFSLALTYGGTNINTSGTQSWVHTLYAEIDKYVYFDDISVFYPPGVQLNLWGMDLWSKALPIMPPIATNITAADVWNVPTTMTNNSWTIWALIKKIYTFILSLL